ncbi:MAG: phytanoyl-CoA dioxygenase family protein [Burkholderiales bacterium]|nr:phytanoyl-CoA dioxygenase family protein [Burkholderiales bacterium]
MPDSSSLPLNSLPASSETGALGVCHVKRLWARLVQSLTGAGGGHNPDYHLDRLVTSALGVGIEQVIRFAAQGKLEFSDFEQWLVTTAGLPHPVEVARINALINQVAAPAEVVQLQQMVNEMDNVLSPADLQQWNNDGYVIVRNAVSAAQAATAAQLVWETAGANPESEQSWYQRSRSNIMLQMFQHPALEDNRRSLRIHKAFAQLWGSVDLWRNTDRCGFNVPERPGHLFGGPDLHWDVSLHQPIPFATQGILYLTDTPPEQGALTLVPGFHHRLKNWLASLPPDADPRQQDLHALGSQAIGGQAGDLVIWHQALPHGSRPNRGQRPRLVQYINMYPAQVETASVWR